MAWCEGDWGWGEVVGLIDLIEIICSIPMK